MEPEPDETPLVFVLGGCNGAGKTTASRTLLAETLRLTTFVNADAIAFGLSAFAPEAVAVEAGRVMLNRLRELAARRESFAFESTLSGRSHARWLSGLRQDGYRINLVFFWLDNAELAVSRVKQRVRQGGHDIPVDTIRTRYRRGIANFFRLYRPIADQWRVYDNSRGGLPRVVAEGTVGHEIVFDGAAWQRIVSESDR